MPSADNVRIAVLIDADNTSPKHAEALLEEVAKYGVPTVKRAYGDWTNSHLNGWRSELPKYAIQPMLQIANTTGKNSTDSALIIDAMDLLYSGNVDAFALVSSDSDFTRWPSVSAARAGPSTGWGSARRRSPCARRSTGSSSWRTCTRAAPSRSPRRPRSPPSRAGSRTCAGSWSGPSTAPPTTTAGPRCRRWPTTSPASSRRSRSRTTARPSSSTWSGPRTTSRWSSPTEARSGSGSPPASPAGSQPGQGEPTSQTGKKTAAKKTTARKRTAKKAEAPPAESAPAPVLEPVREPEPTPEPVKHTVTTRKRSERPAKS